MHVRLTAIRLCLSAWLLLAGCASKPAVAPPTAPAEAPAASVEAPGLFLYEVSGAKGRVHLLGTIHMGFGFEEILTTEARTRFREASRVMTEADVRDADPERLIQAALLPSDRSLRHLVGDATWSTLLGAIGDQIPAPLLDRLEPWLPSVMLGLEDLERALRELKPSSEGKLMDVELVAEAQARGKQISYLETVEEQIAIFDSIPLEEQVRELSRALQNEGGSQARSLLLAFQEGDEQALARALFDETELASSPGFYDRVLYQRNERWLPIIEREIARGGSFIAVGAGHLLGERGLLKSLEGRGYRVQRIGR